MPSKRKRKIDDTKRNLKKQKVDEESQIDSESDDENDGGKRRKIKTSLADSEKGLSSDSDDDIGKENTRKRGPNWTPSDRYKLMEMTKKGNTIEEIAEELDRTVSSVKSQRHRLKNTKKKNDIINEDQKNVTTNDFMIESMKLNDTSKQIQCQKHFEHWSVDEVFEFISKLPLSYCPQNLTARLMKDGMDGEGLLYLELDDLKRYGFDKFSDKKKILKAIEGLDEQ